MSMSPLCPIMSHHTHARHCVLSQDQALLTAAVSAVPASSGSPPPGSPLLFSHPPARAELGANHSASWGLFVALPLPPDSQLPTGLHLLVSVYEIWPLDGLHKRLMKDLVTLPILMSYQARLAPPVPCLNSGLFMCDTYIHIDRPHFQVKDVL